MHNFRFNKKRELQWSCEGLGGCVRHLQLLFLGHKRKQAEDLVQEVLGRALEKWRNWQPLGPLYPWLLTIMRRSYINMLRRTKGHKHVVEIDDAEELPDRSHEPDRRIFLNEVLEMVATLPTEQQDSLLSVAVNGMSYEEVARALQLPIGTVRSRVHRGRAALKLKIREKKSEAQAAPQYLPSVRLLGQVFRPNHNGENVHIHSYFPVGQSPRHWTELLTVRVIEGEVNPQKVIQDLTANGFSTTQQIEAQNRFFISAFANSSGQVYNATLIEVLKPSESDIVAYFRKNPGLNGELFQDLMMSLKLQIMQALQVSIPQLSFR
jgi:RNA polymerase sigma-70 factor (ECF subfamily)